MGVVGLSRGGEEGEGEGEGGTTADWCANHAGRESPSRPVHLLRPHGPGRRIAEMPRRNSKRQAVFSRHRRCPGRAGAGTTPDRSAIDGGRVVSGRRWFAFVRSEALYCERLRPANATALASSGRSARCAGSQAPIIVIGPSRVDRGLPLLGRGQRTAPLLPVTGTGREHAAGPPSLLGSCARSIAGV